MGLFDFFKPKNPSSSQKPQQLDNETLLEWQQLVNGKSDQLVLNQQQLKSSSVFIIQSELRVIDESNKLLNNSINYETFFYRFGLCREKLIYLQQFEKYIRFETMSPTELLKLWNEQEQNVISKFLHRYCEAVIRKADTLKTVKGKRNQYQAFYDSLQKYYYLMDNDNIQYIEKKYRTLTEFLPHDNTSSKKLTLTDISDKIKEYAAEIISECNFNDEDTPDSTKTHIYSSNRKVAIVKVMKSDSAIQFRKVGTPTSYDLKSVDEVKEYLQGIQRKEVD